MKPFGNIREWGTMQWLFTLAMIALVAMTVALAVVGCQQKAAEANSLTTSISR